MAAASIAAFTLSVCVIILSSHGKVVLPNNLRYLENIKYQQMQKDMKANHNDYAMQNGSPMQNNLNGIVNPPNNGDWNQQSMMSNPFLQALPEFVPGTRIRTGFLRNAMSKRKPPLAQQMKSW